MSYTLSSHRESILKRPIRPQSSKNSETSCTQFQREQAQLEHRRDQYRQREYERLRALYGTPEDKKAIQEKLRHELEELEDEKKKLEELQMLEDKRIIEEMKEKEEFEKFVQEDMRKEKEQYAKYLYEENKRIELEKMRREKMTREEEIEEEKKAKDVFYTNAFMKSWR
ncbi:hypothetical protein ADUPG1_010634 [Aduncisulcus paluster]|uniref:Meiosis-specific nuclear structural protein 1 n=1 Tax=Aduncisulcus paluster TaxID=2918883 RepID=A0ABQ5JSR7_9EUKA|nr:hypothetical protein ADUPG1_010634 [Aduncisulcus paluster]|eukprot:gnl/Carplike_NY0171/1918_a2595_782.p1 GENE.gnl/Carplike_NY0171/1918_a2595_782~~gnl/Carplike_NY0171/1918_a2595_782.p1  ORF type:complete len:169 (-),score=52.88 gnl/Carplike_NY0171/1918_a2595_782:113-619(-)